MAVQAADGMGIRSSSLLVGHSGLRASTDKYSLRLLSSPRTPIWGHQVAATAAVP